MMLRWTLVRMTPLAASLLLHAVAYGAIAMAVVPRLMPVQEHVLVADLVEPDPAPPAPPPRASEAPRKAPSPKRVTPPKPTPPKPVEMPLPSVTPAPEPRVETPPPPPPPPPPMAQEPPAPPPAAAPAPRATAPLDAPPASTGEGLPAVARTEPPAAAPAAPAPAMPAAPAPAAPSGPSGPPAASAPAAPGGPSGAAVAAVPHDGVTRTAVPRGGYQVRPSYPANARRLGVQGTTLLSVFVAADGRVADVVVKQSAGHPELDQAAADAVRRWRFEPARRGKEPVAMWVLLPVEFRLR